MNATSLALIAPHHAAKSPAVAVVANWHDEHHDGGFAWCQQQPCLAAREVDYDCDCE